MEELVKCLRICLSDLEVIPVFSIVHSHERPSGNQGPNPWHPDQVSSGRPIGEFINKI